MIVSFHPLFEADKNIISAGREPDADDLAAIKAADAVILVGAICCRNRPDIGIFQFSEKYFKRDWPDPAEHIPWQRRFSGCDGPFGVCFLAAFTVLFHRCRLVVK